MDIVEYGLFCIIVASYIFAHVHSLLFPEALWRELPAHELRKECQEGDLLLKCLGLPQGLNIV